MINFATVLCWHVPKESFGGPYKLLPSLHPQRLQLGADFDWSSQEKLQYGTYLYFLSCTHIYDYCCKSLLMHWINKTPFCKVVHCFSLLDILHLLVPFHMNTPPPPHRAFFLAVFFYIAVFLYLSSSCLPHILFREMKFPVKKFSLYKVKWLI